jgi:thioredoxin reductase (NADPH)
MSDYLIQRVRGSSRIIVHLQAEIVSMRNNGLTPVVQLRKMATPQIIEQEAQHIFVMIGADPNTHWLRTAIELDTNGFIKTGEYDGDSASHFGCSLPGVFAVGDVRSGSVKRVASAVGEGAAVISEVHRFLQKARNC